MNDRRTLAKITCEAEYDRNDKMRARAGDENAWMEFEVRMRYLM